MDRLEAKLIAAHQDFGSVIADDQTVDLIRQRMHAILREGNDRAAATVITEALRHGRWVQEQQSITATSTRVSGGQQLTLEQTHRLLAGTPAEPTAD